MSGFMHIAFIFKPTSRQASIPITLLCALLWTIPSWAAAFASLEIDGGKSELQTNIRAHLDLSDIPCDTTELRLRSRLRGSDDKISNAMRALGYYHGTWELRRERVTYKPTILKNNPLSSAVKKLSNKPQPNNTEAGECWLLKLKLTPGPQTLITKLDVTTHCSPSTWQSSRSPSTTPYNTTSTKAPKNPYISAPAMPAILTASSSSTA